jgi:hypothetical protein
MLERVLIVLGASGDGLPCIRMGKTKRGLTLGRLEGEMMKLPSTHAGQVRGFHFVCVKERGVTKNRNGTFCTGIWAVAEARVTRGAYVALHVARSERSYLPGVVKKWRTRDRKYPDGRPRKRKFGIEFLIEPTDDPLIWPDGGGTGEKAFSYGKI